MTIRAASTAWRLGAVGAFVLVLVALLQTPEPRHGGKTVSQWMRELKVGVKVIKGEDGKYHVMLPNLSDQELSNLQVTRHVRTVPSNYMVSRFFTNWPDQINFAQARKPDDDPANQSVKRLGSAALPYLVAGLRSKESKCENLFYGFVWPRIPALLRHRFRRPVHPIHKRVKAAYALGLLGPAAKPVLAELKQIAESDRDLLVRAVALEAVHRIDPAGAGPFYPELFKEPRPSRSDARVQRPHSSLFNDKLSLGVVHDAESDSEVETMRATQ